MAYWFVDQAAANVESISWYHSRSALLKGDRKSRLVLGLRIILSHTRRTLVVGLAIINWPRLHRNKTSLMDPRSDLMSDVGLIKLERSDPRQYTRLTTPSHPESPPIIDTRSDLMPDVGCWFDQTRTIRPQTIHPIPDPKPP